MVARAGIRHALGLCSALLAAPALAQAPVEIREAGLLVNRQGQPELGISLVNRQEQMLWVRVDFVTPAPEDSCLLSKELAAGDSEFFVCAQRDLLVGLSYLVRISVYADLEQRQLLDRFSTSMRFSSDEVDYIRSLP